MNIKINNQLYYSLIIFALALAFREWAVPYADFDLWLHLFIGREILREESLRLYDAYSFTAQGLEVINHEWLSQIIMAKLQALGSDLALFVWKFIVYASILIFTWLCLDKVKNRLGKICIFILCILAMRAGISFRPQIFSYLFLSLIIFIEEREFLSKNLEVKLKSLLYPLLFLAWSNMHGAFVLGLCICGLYAISREQRFFSKNMLILAVSFVFTLLNPYGSNLYFYIFHELTLGVSKEFISEWQAFSFAARESAFLLVFLICLSGFLAQYRNSNYKNLILFLVAAYLGFSSVRNTPLIAILGLPALIAAINYFLTDKRSSKTNETVYTILAAPTLLLSIFMLLTTNYNFKISTEDDNYPIKSVEWLKKNHVKGNLALPLHWGGYALYHLYPEMRVSIDGRWATVYSEDLMKFAHNLSYNAEKGLWERMLSQAGADYFLAEKDNPALNEFRNNHDWHVIGEESGALLLGKKQYNP